MNNKCSLRIPACCIFAAFLVSAGCPAAAQPAPAAEPLPAQRQTGAADSGPSLSAPGEAVTAGKPQGDMPRAEPETRITEDPLVGRGRYLTVIAGCNDCHTSGFAPSGGSIPEREWLSGDSVGFRGPWGTTYPVNLRYYLKDLNEEQWLTIARGLKSRPPMPSYVLNRMEENDLRGIYRFIKSLGDAGSPVPAYLPPGSDPKTPYIVFDPVIPKTGAGRAAEAGR